MLGTELPSFLINENVQLKTNNFLIIKPKIKFLPKGNSFTLLTGFAKRFHNDLPETQTKHQQTVSLL